MSGALHYVILVALFLFLGLFAIDRVRDKFGTRWYIVAGVAFVALFVAATSGAF